MARTAAPRRRKAFEFPNSLDFSGGSNVEMNIGTAIYGFERTDPFSWSFWIRPRLDASNTQIIVGEFAASPFEGWHSRFVNGYIRGWLIGSAGGGSSLRKDFNPPPLNEWTMVTFTYDGSSGASGLKCYFGPDEQTAQVTLNSLATSIVAGDAEMVWGNFGATGSPGFDGLLVPIGVFDYELSASQVADLYYLGEVTGDAAVDYYPLDEGSGTDVASVGSGGNDGTLNGVTWNSSNTPGKARSPIPQQRLPSS